MGVRARMHAGDGVMGYWAHPRRAVRSPSPALPRATEIRYDSPHLGGYKKLSSSKMFPLFICVVVVRVASTAAAAGPVALGFATSYGDHMVLQQGPKQAVVWGHCGSACAKVCAHFDGGGTPLLAALLGPQLWWWCWWLRVQTSSCIGGVVMMRVSTPLLSTPPQRSPSRSRHPTALPR